MCLAPRDFSPLSVAETPSTLKEFAAERIEAQKEQYVKRRRPQKVSAEWDHLPSDYKYWIYPAACLVAWYLGKSEFMAHLMAGTLLRYAINLAFTALSKLDCVAEPRRIHKENPPANQLERELDWDGPIILSPVAFLLVDALTPWFSTIAPFSAKGVGVMFAAHYGIVEPLYYVFHRFLHNPQVYKASHQHHHTSIITEAISGTSHPLLESVGYLANFSFPFLVPAWCGCFSFPLVYLYFTFFDVLNCIGHCNFELVPRWAQKGPLKWLLYTGAYHSLHHSKFKFNFVLFCPMWDYMCGTVHPSSDTLHATVLSQTPRKTDVVFLGHGFDAASMVHLPWLSPYMASHQHRWRWWFAPLYPFLGVWTLFCRYALSTAVVQRYGYRGTKCATWCLPITGHFYLPSMKQHHAHINKMIEKALVEADDAGVRYVGLGALNKAEWLNRGGKDLLPLLEGRKLRLVHGNTLTAAAVWRALELHTSPTDEVVVTGPTAKIGRVLSLLLARRGNKVRLLTSSEERYLTLKAEAARLFGAEAAARLTRAPTYADAAGAGVWVIGKLIRADDLKAHVAAGSLLIDYAVPHVPDELAARYRYVNGAALAYEPRDTDLTFCHDVPGTVPACLAATIIHCREESREHECGEVDLESIDGWWKRAEAHGFRLAHRPVAGPAA